MAAKYEILAAQLRRLCTRMKRRGETKLPSETELAVQTGNSRQTIRHALRMLEEEGLIRRVLHREHEIAALANDEISHRFLLMPSRRRPS